VLGAIYVTFDSPRGNDPNRKLQNNMNYIQKIQAVNTFRNDYGIDQTRKEYIKRGEAELRTKKNNHLAVKWDELGNAFVLTAKGTTLQLIGNEYQGR